MASCVLLAVMLTNSNSCPSVTKAVRGREYSKFGVIHVSVGCEVSHVDDCIVNVIGLAHNWLFTNVQAIVLWVALKTNLR